MRWKEERERQRENERERVRERENGHTYLWGSRQRRRTNREENKDFWFWFLTGFHFPFWGLVSGISSFIMWVNLVSFAPNKANKQFLFLKWSCCFLVSHRVLATHRECLGIVRCQHVLPVPCLIKASTAQEILHPEIPLQAPQSLPMHSFCRAVPGLSFQIPKCHLFIHPSY